MTYRESAVLFRCEDDELVGIVATPALDTAAVGVLIVVGGPQYRVGSHRQFVLLSRYLAEGGIPSMRFDYRGMGDASGAQRNFEGVEKDLRAAVDAFFVQVPGLEKLVIWGLCDGASAGCLYAPLDRRVAGLVLLNPWVKTDSGVARTFLRHYYLRRLLDRSFWKKLLAGGVSIGRSAGELAGAAVAAQRGGAGKAVGLPERMADALLVSAVPFVVLLSRRDYVAREFEDVARRFPKWQQLLRGERHLGTEYFDTDHTFSTAKARLEAARATLEQVRRLACLHGDHL